MAEGLAPSRARAQALIAAGVVTLDGRVADKPGLRVPAAAVLAVTGDPLPWVSRAALKLVHALDVFGIDPAGLVALDLGASTGGFTEVLLARGATEVWAVDVGHGQLAWKLRSDPRVVVLDEATAALDSTNERAIQEALGEALAGRTAIVIAHRLSTVRSADEILVVEAGRIVERGTHAALLAAGGRYAELYTTQFADAE